MRTVPCDRGRHATDHRRQAEAPSGFTLIELSIVILIIGLLMAFVLAASLAGLESARVSAPPRR